MRPQRQCGMATTAMKMMAMMAARVMAGRYIDDWDDNNASTMMISLLWQIDKDEEGGM